VFEEVLVRNDYFHEFHFYAGDHSETYWAAHVDEYLLWYVEVWNDAPIE